MKKESGEEYGKSETEKFLQLSRFGRYGAFQRCKKTFLYLRKRHVYCGTTDYKFIYSTAQRELFGFQLQNSMRKRCRWTVLLMNAMCCRCLMIKNASLFMTARFFQNKSYEKQAKELIAYLDELPDYLMLVFFSEESAVWSGVAFSYFTKKDAALDFSNVSGRLMNEWLMAGAKVFLWKFLRKT